MSRILVSGQHLVLHGISGTASDQNGLATCTITVNVPDLATVFSLNPSLVAQAVGLNTNGVSLTGAPYTQNENGSYDVTYTFSGTNPQYTWTSALADNLATYALVGNDTESPIGAHKKFSTLRTTYGWIPDDDSKPSGPGHFPFYKQNMGSLGISKLYGTTGWLTFGCEFRKTYVFRGAPTSWVLVGTVVADPPDLYKAFGLVTPQGRNWLVMAPEMETIGKAVRVTERWRQSGPGGVNRDLYSY